MKFEAEQAQSCVFGAEFSSRTEFSFRTDFSFRTKRGSTCRRNSFRFRLYCGACTSALGFILSVSLCELHVFAMEILRSLQENSFSLSLASSLVFAGRASWWAFEELSGASRLRSPSGFPFTAFIKRTFIAQTKNILRRSCIYFTSFV